MNTIVVPVDGSEESKEALRYACESFSPDQVVLFHVIAPSTIYGHTPDSGVYTEQLLESQQERAERLFEELQPVIDSIDSTIPVETITEIGRPATTIVRFAEENDVDQVVMGSRGRDGAARILLGSVAETVVRRASMPVTVVR